MPRCPRTSFCLTKLRYPLKHSFRIPLSNKRIPSSGILFTQGTIGRTPTINLSTLAKKDGKSKRTIVVSFRIANSLHQELAQGETDEAGLELTPSGMARRLVIEALRATKKE